MCILGTQGAMQQGKVTKGCGDDGGWPCRQGQGLRGAEHVFSAM
jgi:hypothetical protein